VSSPTSRDFYDGELRAHHEHLRAAYGIRPGDEVVDIGCGTGLTTHEARAAAPGGVVGVDVSERMLERARQLTADEPLGSVRYELGGAQVHRFDPAAFDVAISRFGTMFFSDPAAAFANIAAAMRPDARGRSGHCGGRKPQAQASLIRRSTCRPAVWPELPPVGVEALAPLAPGTATLPPVLLVWP
jgi:SAM-dependent methyltransferase